MNSVTGDLIFKLIFSNERSKRILIHLLNSIIDSKGNPITGVTVRKTELTPEYLGGKDVRLDVLAEASDGRLINVEIQRKNEENFVDRSLYYWAELYSQQLQKGAEYSDLRQTICINILEESLFKDDRFWRTHHMSDDETHEILTRMEEIHFLELKKMREFRKDSPITWWVEYLKDPHSETVQKIGEFEPIIKEAVQMFDHVTSDPQTREFIRMREKGVRDYNSAVKNAERKGMKEGRTEGIREGRMEEKREAASSMLADGMSVDSVSKYTGLSPSELQSLKQR